MTAALVLEELEVQRGEAQGAGLDMVEMGVLDQAAGIALQEQAEADMVQGRAHMLIMAQEAVEGEAFWI
jgi:hypothetical protein